MKIRNRSDKKKQSGKIIGLVVIGIIIAIIAIAVDYTNEQKRIEQENRWIISGPFAINKDHYKLAEYVFMSVQGLQPTDVGKILILSPNNKVYDTIPFNGTMKNSFKQYFKPNTQRSLALCTPEELVGNWTLVFQGTQYKPIPFKLINDWISGGQAEIKPVPKGLDPC